MPTTTETTKQGWQKLKLGDVCDFNVASIGKSYPHKQIKYIDISSVGTGILNEPTKYNILEAPGRAKRLVSKGDIIISNVRPNRRSFAYLKNPEDNHVASTGFTVISSKRDISDSRFIYYIISDQKFTDYLTNNAKGCAYPAVETATFKNAEIIIPSIFEQKKIAEVLGAYDDLIEVNQKKIKILEELAQSIYKEWFVKPTQNGIPEGWEEIELGKKIKVLSGFAFRGKDYIENAKYNIVTIKNVHDGKFINNFNSFINEFPKGMPNHCILKDGDILLSLTGNVGRVCLNFGNNNLLNQRVSKLETKYKSFAYCLFRNKDFFNHMVLLANGVAQQNLSPIDVGKMKIICPKDSILDEFDKIVFSMIEDIININQQNKNLQKTRDLLIPQLVGGKLIIN
jgi:type I restriction enzyme S subunit